MKFHRNFERTETKRFVKNIPRTPLADFSPGATIYGLVLGSTREDTTVIDLGSGALVRWRIPWPEGIQSDLRLFGVVEAVIADDPADDDLAQPEAITLVPQLCASTAPSPNPSPIEGWHNTSKAE